MCLATVMLLVTDSAAGSPDWWSRVDHRQAFIASPEHQAEAPTRGVWGLGSGYQAGSAT